MVYRGESYDATQRILSRQEVKMLGLCIVFSECQHQTVQLYESTHEGGSAVNISHHYHHHHYHHYHNHHHQLVTSESKDTTTNHSLELAISRGTDTKKKNKLTDNNRSSWEHGSVSRLINNVW